MTFFFRWIWQENDQFLLTFTLYDDFKNRNLRGKNRYIYFISEGNLTPTPKLEPIYTWAPRHTEQGQIAELLSWANRINGSKKRFIIKKLIEEVIDVVLPRPRPVFDPAQGELIIYDDSQRSTEETMLTGFDVMGYFVAFPLTERWVKNFTTIPC